MKLSYKPKEEDIIFIKENYMQKTSKEIATIIGCSSGYVKKIGKEVSKGQKKGNRYHCQENYFEKINTYEKAYCLGFLMAAGCIYTQKNNKNAQSWVKIILQIKDKNHLEKFNKSIEGNYPIRIFTKKNTERQYCDITIVSNKMAKDLRKWGCVEQKTPKVYFPKLDNDLLNFGFLQGYIDGDGSISKAKNGNNWKYSLRIVGTKSFIYGINNFLQKFNIKGHIREDKRQYSFPFFEIYIERRDYLLFIFKNTYEREIVYLDRKYERVQEYLATKPKIYRTYCEQITPSLIEI